MSLLQKELEDYEKELEKCLELKQSSHPPRMIDTKIQMLEELIYATREELQRSKGDVVVCSNKIKLIKFLNSADICNFLIKKKDGQYHVKPVIKDCECEGECDCE